MPRVRASLFGPPNQRNYDSLQTLISAKDQRFIGGVIVPISSSLGGGTRIAFAKRPGMETVLTPASGSNGQMIHFSRTQAKYITSFVTGGTTTVYIGTTSCGTTA